MLMIGSQFALVQIIKIQQSNQLMTEQVPSKKWVDYTDQESQEDQQAESHQKDTSISNNIPQSHHSKQPKKTYRPTKAQIDKELDKLDQLDDDRFDEVWIEMSSQDAKYLATEIEYLKSIAKKGGNIVSVYQSRLQNTFEVKVYIKIAYDYIQKGYDQTDLMKVIVAERNFNRKEEAKGRNRRQNDFKEGDKKKYVDKETGLQPPPKIKKEDSNNLENDRKYSKKEAEKKGEELGNFRSKQSKKEVEENKNVPETNNSQGEKKEEVKVSEPAEEKVKIEVKEQVKAEKKQEGKQQVAKESKKGKVEKKKSKGGNKYKSQNRFQGIQDLD